MKQEKAVKNTKLVKNKKNGKKKIQREKKKKQAEKANNPLNQKARVKRIQGFEHQWIGGPKEIKSRPKRLNQAVPNYVLVACRSK